MPESTVLISQDIFSLTNQNQTLAPLISSGGAQFHQISGQARGWAHLVIVFVESKFQDDSPPPNVSLKRNIIVEIKCGNKMVVFFFLYRKEMEKSTSDVFGLPCLDPWTYTLGQFSSLLLGDPNFGIKFSLVIPTKVSPFVHKTQLNFSFRW